MGRAHAVVIGAGIAGLLNARVLADHFERVTVIEQDTLPDHPAHRRGTPQDAHLHGLLLRGRQVVEQLVPGFTDDLIAHGAPTIDLAADLAIRSPFGWGRRARSDLRTVSASRILVERVIRRRVATRSTITIRDRTQVVALAGTSTRIAAVRVRPGFTENAIEELPVDLVVDATGRGSRSSHWLRDLGCPPPPEQTLNSRVGYASRLYEIPAQHCATWKLCLLQTTPTGPLRGAALMPIEHNRWVVTLIGIGPHRPTRREEDFLPFARSLPSPIVAEALHNAEPLTDIAISTATSNHRRHPDRVAQRPDNLLVTGDALCSFNPVYAQGMTAAATCAALLGDCLDRHDADGSRSRISSHYYRRVRPLLANCWTLATTADCGYPDGPPPTPRQRITRRYLDRVLLAGTHDFPVQLAFLRVLNMLRPPASLLEPAVVARVLRNHHPTADAIPSHPPGDWSGPRH
ncbi:FAD-dependent oxidoreductase [Streptomyces sp. NPDC059070]|uniref:FAD-dependent oxidoreductase n=1 Tax=Streptomyces sp. NPDC059070 TaxID=3346713 RepID=UPI00369BE5E0